MVYWLKKCRNNAIFWGKIFNKNFARVKCVPNSMSAPHLNKIWSTKLSQVNFREYVSVK